MAWVFYGLFVTGRPNILQAIQILKWFIPIDAFTYAALQTNNCNKSILYCWLFVLVFTIPSGLLRRGHWTNVQLIEAEACCTEHQITFERGAILAFQRQCTHTRISLVAHVGSASLPRMVGFCNISFLDFRNENLSSVRKQSKYWARKKLN